MYRNLINWIWIDINTILMYINIYINIKTKQNQSQIEKPFWQNNLKGTTYFILFFYNIYILKHMTGLLIRYCCGVKIWPQWPLENQTPHPDLTAEAFVCGIYCGENSDQVGLDLVSCLFFTGLHGSPVNLRVLRSVCWTLTGPLWVRRQSSVTDWTSFFSLSLTLLQISYF